MIDELGKCANSIAVQNPLNVQVDLVWSSSSVVMALKVFNQKVDYVRGV